MGLLISYKMEVGYGTQWYINYYFHCKRQCYLFGNRMNLEDNSEEVKIGKAIHEEKADQGKNTELAVENIKLDRLDKH